MRSCPRVHAASCRHAHAQGCASRAEPFDLAGSLRSPGDEGVQKPLQEERVEAEEKYSSV